MERAIELAASFVQAVNHPFGAIYWSGIKTIIFACPFSALEEIAGEGLCCHSGQVFENSVNPPQVKGPLLEMQAVEQHRRYWKQK